MVRWLEDLRRELGRPTGRLTRRQATQALHVAARCVENLKLRQDLLELATLLDRKEAPCLKTADRTDTKPPSGK